jgi:pilus assembly protein FimV
LVGEPAASPTAAAAAAPAPVAPEPIKPDATPATTEGQFNELLTNPIVLGVIGGAAGLLVLLLLLLWARHRNARRAEENTCAWRGPWLRSRYSLRISTTTCRRTALKASKYRHRTSLAAAPAPAPAPEPAVAAPSVARTRRGCAVVPQSANDALAQAQSHIDRGHLNQAADVLEQAIKHEPARSDLRLN